jgi:atlastin
VGPEFLQLQHTRCHEAALRRFQSVRKMGGEQFSQPYVDQLESYICDHYACVIRQNEAKNVFSAARTPAVIFGCSAISYVLSGILGTLGLMTLANIANVAMLLFIALLSVWIYARYTGEHREYGQFVDRLADILWDEVSQCFI